MMNRCSQVQVADAHPGMVLSETILDGDGSVLLPCGTTLTDLNLRSLWRRGIDRIMVVNDKVSEAELEAERAQLRQRLAKLFRKHADNDKNRLLLQYLSEYRLGEAS